MASRPVTRAFRTASVCLVLFCWNATLLAQPCEPVVGRVVSIEGRVELQREGTGDWEPASLNDPICQRDTVRAGRSSRAAIALINEAILRIDEGTTLRLLNVTGVEEETSLLDLLRGAIKSFSRKPRLIKVTTPYLNGAIEGTEFQLEARPDSATLTVLEGLVRAENPRGDVLVAPGQAASAGPDAAPVIRTLVRPRDAVQWTLYYPPVLAALGGDSSAVGEVTPEFARVLSSAAGGDIDEALAEIERVPEPSRGGRFYALRAALLLSVGRVDAATADIQRSIALEPDVGLAYALRAIINVVTNRRAEALDDGRRAVELSPSPAGRIALSYAQQASFQLEAARDTLLAAVEAHPENALAWARLGELQLMLGERRQAKSSAATAGRLAPNLARTQLLVGYAALAEFRKSEAHAAFERAVELSSADPMTHLGLGLVEISQGRLAEGRQRIEVAVGLDSNSALLRAYLGKAYFEEKRAPLDAEQYSIAKGLDPLDPTAYLYDAIAKQSTNRPVEALEDLEASIERNDNRAVYRGRLLLDEDRAARGTSLARVYDNLGFGRLGTKESTESLTTDPSNASAHRFLSDTYRAQTRREAARVSELLQAQTMQDININPIQPSISSTNLNIVTSGGPTTTGFSEFTPLFEQNQAQLNVSGLAGSNDTRSGEVVLSGIYNQFSASGGLFDFETDGFRANNDLSHSIYDFYVQAAVTPEFNIQAEVRGRETDRGDIAMNFDPDSFDPNLRQNVDETNVRASARYSPNVYSDFIVSYIHSERDLTGSTSSTQVQTIPVPFPPFLITITADSSQLTKQSNDADQFEGLHIYKAERFNVTSGMGYARVETGGALQASTVFTSVPPGFAPPPSTQTFPVDSETDDWRAYSYWNIELGKSLTGTLGASYQNFDSTLFRIERINPKAGIQWDLSDSLRARAAYFEVVKPVLASNRTLEPTQVAGFNQVFDDADGTRSKRYGAGLDWQMTQDLYAGVEFTGREIKQPIIDLTTNSANFEDRDEVTYRAYLYWTPLVSVAARLEAIYDNFEKEMPSTSASGITEVKSVSIPLTATFFHPSGLFASVGATYVDQEVDRISTSTLASGKDNFVIVDAGVGFRLPRRTGILSIGVQNIFDEEFMFQDDSYRTFQDEPSGTPYVPERTIMGVLTLSF